MPNVVQVRVRQMERVLPFDTNGLQLKPGDLCIVEHDQGLEAGEVVSEVEDVVGGSDEPPRKVVRLAGEEDRKKIEINEKHERQASETCEKRIAERELPMKLVTVEETFDGSKLIFYFTAEGRVDFRELVKDLAHTFKTRIEMRQIGVRDEAKMLGGVGCCGRTLCCAAFLRGFEPVSIRMARDQKLSLNPEKISGLCGRLMCCLSFEHATYRELLKGLPKEGSWVATEKGEGEVVSVNVLARRLTVELADGEQVDAPAAKVRPARRPPPKPEDEKGEKKETKGGNDNRSNPKPHSR